MKLLFFFIDIIKILSIDPESLVHTMETQVVCSLYGTSDKHQLVVCISVLTYKQNKSSLIEYAFQVDAIGAIASKFSSVEPEAATFDNAVELLKLKFLEQKSETLTEAIQCLQQSNDEKVIAIAYRDVVFDLSRDFFYLKLKHTINDIFQQPQDYHTDSNKYLFVLNICLNSKLSFQHFYTHTALLMIQHQYPNVIQTFLDQFILDISIRQQTEDDFVLMYEESLQLYVRVSYICKDSSKKIEHFGQNLLKNLRLKDMTKFVIVTSHFENFRHLLENEKCQQ